jgi:hypothetical protein
LTQKRKKEEERKCIIIIIRENIYEHCILTQQSYFFLDYINLIVYKDKLEKIKTKKQQEIATYIYIYMCMYVCTVLF